MNSRSFITFAIVLMLTVFGASSVFADVQVTQRFYEAIIKQDGSVQYTTNPVMNVNVNGFICSDASCSAVSGTLFGGATLNSGNSNQITLSYPTNPQYTSGNSYGVFFSRSDYVAWEQTPTWYGNGVVQQQYNAYLGKIEMCRIAIDEFAVINDVYPNQPIMIDILANLDATVHSPIKNAGPIAFIPSQLQSNYQIQAQIKLDILDQNGNIVNTQVQNVPIDFSSSRNVHFEYTPTELGRYSARVTTTATDNKCLQTDSQFSQKNYNVITQNPTNQCYMLLNNLATRPVDPRVGQAVIVSVAKTNNFYDANGNLFPLDSQIIFTVQKDGQTVTQQTLTVGANQDTFFSQNVEFTWTPTEAGYYTVNVAGQGLSCPFNVNTADTASQSFYVTGTSDPNPNPNQAPIFQPLPTVTLGYNSGFNNNVLNVANYAFDADGDQLTFGILSQSNPSIVSCVLDVQNNLDCTVQQNQFGCSNVLIQTSDSLLSAQATAQVCVAAPNTAPTLSQIPDVTLVQNSGLNQNVLLLPNYASDVDGDSLTFSIATQSNPSIANCQINVQQNLDCTAPIGGSLGSSQVMIVVSDGSLVASQFITVTVVPTTSAQSCVGPDNAVIAHGSSRTYFQAASAVSCTSEVRSCMNGVLSGSFQFASCTPITTPQNLPPSINLPDVGIQKNAGTATVLNVTSYISDPENDVLTVTLLSQSKTDVVSCTLNVQAQLVCTTKPNRIGQSQITIQVSDGTSIVSDSMIVTVFANQPTNVTNPQVSRETGLFISQFQVGDYYGSSNVPLIFTVRNDYSTRLTGIKIAITSVDIDLRAVAGPFSLGAGESVSRVVQLPLDNVKPGIYTLRMTISSSNGLERVVHRDLIIR